MSNYPTMTLHEMCEAFRANQVPCTEAILGEYVVLGKFPFAVGTPPTESRRNSNFIISREGCYQWLAGFLHREVRRIPDPQGRRE